MSEATVQFVEIARQHAANTARYPLKCTCCRRHTNHRLVLTDKVCNIYECGVCHTQKLVKKETKK